MAKQQPELPTTQRAYTLRLRGIDGDDTWRDALWATHEAVNKGAKVFGDWLLTLRGGLDHQLAEDGPPEQRKDRRILLALSWMSVEDSRSAPSELLIPQPLEALREILGMRGLDESEVEAWLADCSHSVSARIKDEATWVNRSAAFDAFSQRIGGAIDREYARRTVLGTLELKGPYFVLPALSDDEDGRSATTADEGPLVNEATGWLCDNWGAGRKSDKGGISRILGDLAAVELSPFIGKPGIQLIEHICAIADIPCTDSSSGDKALKAIFAKIGWQGRPSAARIALEAVADASALSSELADRLQDRLRTESVGKLAESKIVIPCWMPVERARLEGAIGMTYRDHKDRTFEFAVMLDHAMRRVSGVHSWIKNAEAERRRFEEDSRRISNVPPESLAWLEGYCAERTRTSGALEPYRIRRRAIDGWDKIVERWSRPDCQTAQDRVKVARELQDDPEIEKFGDIQLFEALADDDAQSAWNSGGKPSAQPLKDFVFAKDAQAKQQRFKVPAYRHPDPLRHPVFTDFGNSRWNIDFSAHRAPESLPGLAAKVEKTTHRLRDAQQKLAPLAGEKRAKLTATIAQLHADLAEAERRHMAMADRNRLEMLLWNGQSVEPTALRWSGKRLTADLNLRPNLTTVDPTRVQVTRADRLGRAAGGAEETQGVSIVNLFGEKDWNGRLQAPRAQLDAIAQHVDEHDWDAKAQTKLRRIRWLLSFSAKLTPFGPWLEYCGRSNDAAPAKPFVSRKGEYAIKHASNGTRQGHAKLMLSRLPRLRILSVDLGHRFAAACTAWEAISINDMRTACAAAAISPPPTEALFAHLTINDRHGKATTTIYRRIGPDTLPDGSAHSAPWARLDRQFLIKLQGEDRPARKASSNEITAIEEFELWAGKVRDPQQPPRDRAVDALMSDAVRTARLALARHARRARIAYNLTAPSRVRPGGIAEPLTSEMRLALLLDTLADWHALGTDCRWQDPASRDLWNQHLAGFSGGFQLKPIEGATQDGQPTKAQRRQQDQDLRRQLDPLATMLAANVQLCIQLNAAWAARWNEDDLQWHNKLHWLSRWLMPRGVHRCDTSHRHVGGLSLRRLATLTEFRRKVQVGFFTRRKPDGTRADLGRRFGQSTLDAIERLKDNRVKQLASRIVEAALGIGIERHSASGRNVRRPRQQLDGPRFAPCHAVVIEDLSHYRPEETRTRRENRATMDWKSAEARKRLADACQLHGLHLRDVNPQYTSRQDSRTAAPGVRCIDVPAADFLTAPAWKKTINAASGKSPKERNPREQFLLDLHAHYTQPANLQARIDKPLRLPVKGGDLFVSASTGKAIQADLNAAANIGLRALLDPDFIGKWWYVPCDPATLRPKAEKVKGSILDGAGPLATVEPRKPGAREKTKEVVNLWRDPSALPIVGGSGHAPWLPTPAYWRDVEHRVIAKLRIFNGLDPDLNLEARQIF